MGSNISTDLSPSVPRWQCLVDDKIKLASVGDADRSRLLQEIDGMHAQVDQALQIFGVESS
jgi:hypothetical protein